MVKAHWAYWAYWAYWALGGRTFTKPLPSLYQKYQAFTKPLPNMHPQSVITFNLCTQSHLACVHSYHLACVHSYHLACVHSYHLACVHSYLSLRLG